MTKTLFILICMLMMSMPFYCVNHMDTMTTMTGEFMGTMFGSSIASLDFNGDGIKDLVVCAHGWNPTGVYDSHNSFGKLYFYIGGANFDNIPEYTIEGTYHFNLDGRIYNAGDVDGDGKEDLAMATGSREIPPDTNEVHSLYIYYGRDIPQAMPDYTLNVDGGNISNFVIEPLGDINNDGYDDLAMLTDPYLRGHWVIKVILGNSFQQVDFMQNDGWNLIYLSGVGDINNDGIDDFHMYFPNSYTSFTQNRLILYYGNSSFPDCDSLTICENTDQEVKYEGCSVGDVNGDGIGDFISDMGSTGKVWFGGSDLSPAWDVSLSPGWFALNGPGPAVVYGDLNGDGCDDLIGSQFNDGPDSGNACVWLGGQQFNGTVDLYYGNPHIGQQFGWAKATGDFNNDGFCDVTISEPNWWGNSPLTIGYVHVYKGSSSLLDTTSATDDNAIVPPSKLWALTVYPNPVQSGKIKLNLNLTGEGYKTLTSAKLLLCNPKGQTVYSSPITARELKSGAWQSKQLKLSLGVYLVSIKADNKNLITKKLTIVK